LSLSSPGGELISTLAVPVERQSAGGTLTQVPAPSHSEVAHSVAMPPQGLPAGSY
jgi:hypothetical protein